MPESFTRRILQHVADKRYDPRSVDELARDLNIADEDLADFRASVQSLIKSGDAVMTRSDQIALPPPGQVVIGTFRLHHRGFGFLVPDSPLQHGDLFVPPNSTGNAMTGDRVRARVRRDKGRAKRSADHSPFVGVVDEIIQRAEHHYVGNLKKRGNTWLVYVDGKMFDEPVVVRDPGAKNASVGDKVLVELIAFPEKGELPEGVILEVLGEAGRPDVETLAVMKAYGLPDRFPDAVMQDARDAAKTFDDDAVPDERSDLTGEYIITIDPPDARDFDDAISIRRMPDEQGRSGPADAVWELGVHIADVSHFVRPGTALDDEAYERGNSTYLPRKVVPMLPELLSNGVCSLQEGVNRFTKSVKIWFDDEGKPLDATFYSAVIRSEKRLTYLEAQALMDDDLREARKHAKTEPKYGGPLIAKLKLMKQLARTIEKRRMSQGMITLGLPEVELMFDDAGNVVDAEPEDDAYTHKVIEMFMVEANEAAARLFDNLNVPMIRRIHPDPPSHDMSELRQFARVAGYNIPKTPTRFELQQLLDKVRGTPAQQAVHLAVLQTLSKAEYSPMRIGHFALASEHYTHFTSPIRRYPDLIVHRALQAYLELQTDENKRSKKQLTRDLQADRRVPPEEELFQLGKHCSGTERNSESAERELRTYLVLELLTDHLGDDFDATVTGVTSNGVFMQIDK